ncbi:neurofilament medium polypeptide isoform X2 [Nematostella vectensis]|uniref:neurofilament medium polypeptide isoform X2 n=1 Tax=Nematostella vectensis TaxID=45351 RepID=UPI002076F229|nr:neurofilament medium polypeptide isoform X2 [Nematostella vectensis]
MIKQIDDLDNSEGWVPFFHKLNWQSRENAGKVAAAKLPANRPLNRYRDVLPYDHSRIILESTQNGTDYINANLVEFPELGKRYILAQGPLPHTADHFWQMVWENNSKAVIMLNKVMEKNQIKCFQYWPCGERYAHVNCLELDSFQIKYITENRSEEFTVRILELENKKTKETRVVYHYHYLTWPDFGVPKAPGYFLSFLFECRNAGVLSSDVGPAVIHCSAGIGRSGTFVMIDSILAEVEATGNLNAVDLGERLLAARQYRVGLIQTPDQLRFTSIAILEGTLALFPDIYQIAFDEFMAQKEREFAMQSGSVEEEPHEDEESPPLPPRRKPKEENTSNTAPSCQEPEEGETYDTAQPRPRHEEEDTSDIKVPSRLKQEVEASDTTVPPRRKHEEDGAGDTIVPEKKPCKSLSDLPDERENSGTMLTQYSLTDATTRGKEAKKKGLISTVFEKGEKKEKKAEKEAVLKEIDVAKKGDGREAEKVAKNKENIVTKKGDDKESGKEGSKVEKGPVSAEKFEGEGLEKEVDLEEDEEVKENDAETDEGGEMGEDEEEDLEAEGNGVGEEELSATEEAKGMEEALTSREKVDIEAIDEEAGEEEDVEAKDNGEDGASDTIVKEKKPCKSLSDLQDDRENSGTILTQYSLIDATTRDKKAKKKGLFSSFLRKGKKKDKKAEQEAVLKEKDVAKKEDGGEAEKVARNKENIATKKEGDKETGKEVSKLEEGPVSAEKIEEVGLEKEVDLEEDVEMKENDAETDKGGEMGEDGLEEDMYDGDKETDEKVNLEAETDEVEGEEELSTTEEGEGMEEVLAAGENVDIKTIDEESMEDEDDKADEGEDLEARDEEAGEEEDVEAGYREEEADIEEGHGEEAGDEDDLEAEDDEGEVDIEEGYREETGEENDEEVGSDEEGEVDIERGYEEETGEENDEEAGYDEEEEVDIKRWYGEETGEENGVEAGYHKDEEVDVEAGYGEETGEENDKEAGYNEEEEVDIKRGYEEETGEENDEEAGYDEEEEVDIKRWYGEETGEENGVEAGYHKDEEVDVEAGYGEESGEENDVEVMEKNAEKEGLEKTQAYDEEIEEEEHRVDSSSKRTTPGSDDDGLSSEGSGEDEIINLSASSSDEDEIGEDGDSENEEEVVEKVDMLGAGEEEADKRRTLSPDKDVGIGSLCDSTSLVSSLLDGDTALGSVISKTEGDPTCTDSRPDSGIQEDSNSLLEGEKIDRLYRETQVSSSGTKTDNMEAHGSDDGTAAKTESEENVVSKEDLQQKEEDQKEAALRKRKWKEKNEKTAEIVSKIKDNVKRQEDWQTGYGPIVKKVLIVLGVCVVAFIAYKVFSRYISSTPKVRPPKLRKRQ